MVAKASAKAIIRGTRRLTSEDVRVLAAELGLSSRLGSAKRVIVKVNLCAGHRFRGETGINVEPELVREVVLALRSLCPAETRIGVAETDSVGGSFADDKFEFQELKALLDGIPNVDLVNLSQVHRVSVPCTRRGRARSSYELPRTVFEAEVLVNLGKIKTHNLSTITGALKGNFGMLPGDKSQYHPQLSDVIADLASILPAQQFCLLDGNPGMVGDGPVRGESRAFGVVIASSHVVACDYALATVLGIPPQSVAHLVRAAEGLDVPCAADIRYDLLEDTVIWPRAPQSRLERRFYLSLGLLIQRWGASIERFGHAVHGIRSTASLVAGARRRLLRLLSARAQDR